MWPWGHLAFAYVCYSLLARAVHRRPPTTREAIAVAVGSQLPDLIDKPLAWTFGVTETGYSIGHSILVAPFVCVAVYAVAARLRSRALAGAFSLAFLSHPAADVLNRVLGGEPVDLRMLLWPIASPPPDPHSGLVDQFALYFVRYVYLVLSGELTLQIVFQALLGLLVVALWLSDGAPVAADIWRLLSSRHAISNDRRR